jgi:hypothetical protein
MCRRLEVGKENPHVAPLVDASMIGWDGPASVAATASKEKFVAWRTPFQCRVPSA